MAQRTPRIGSSTLEELRFLVASRVDARLQGGRLLRGSAALTIALDGDCLVLDAPPEPPRILPANSTPATLVHAADLLLFRASVARSSPSAAVAVLEELCALPGAARLGGNQLRIGDLVIEVCTTGLRIEAFLPFPP